MTDLIAHSVSMLCNGSLLFVNILYHKSKSDEGEGRGKFYQGSIWVHCKSRAKPLR